MNIIENKVVDDEGVEVASFDKDYKVTYLVDDLSQKAKMSIGRKLGPLRRKVEIPERDAEPVKAPKPKKEEPAPKVECTDASIDPWDAFPDCPKPGPLGDKTHEIVEFLYENHPAYYRLRYAQRKTIIDGRHKREKDEWIDRGADYCRRDMRISDCPANATLKQQELFEYGFRKYMEAN